MAVIHCANISTVICQVCVTKRKAFIHNLKEHIIITNPSGLTEVVGDLNKENLNIDGGEIRVTIPSQVVRAIAHDF